MNKIKLLFFITLCTVITKAYADFPLRTLPDDHSRDYWLPEQVNHPGLLDGFQSVVSKPGTAIDFEQGQPVSIAVIYPSQDVSDFWIRNYTALTKRLDEIQVDYKITEYSSKQIEHTQQTRYTEEVLSNSDKYDIVIFGPSELSTQANNIQLLSASKDFHTFIWAFHTPIKAWTAQPRLWLDFSSAMGAQVMCEYMIQRLGTEVLVALNRGIPGITDQQRSGDFKQCVTENGDWEILYEHYGQYQRAGGKDGTSLIYDYYPEVEVIHNANTAMAVGSVDYMNENQKDKPAFITGWGGTEKELQLIQQKKLNATPMRLSDDLGVASAEAIRFILEGKESQLPTIYLGRITIADDRFSTEDLDGLKKSAFRYSSSIK